MPATEVTQNFFEAKPLWVGKVGAAGVASAVATTIPAQSAANLTNGNAYIVTVNRTDATGTVKHPANERETFIGKLSGTNFINCTRGVEGEAQAWEADTVLEILMTAEQWNKLIEGIEAEHGSDGKHKIDKLDAVRYAADAGASDAYAITLSPAPTSYYAGMTVVFKANTANTGACTLNVNSLGAKDIKKFGASGVVALNDNDLQANQTAIAIYDGTQFILIGSPGLITGASIVNPILSTTANGNLEINPNGAGVIKAKTTLQLRMFSVSSDQTTGDGKAGFCVPEELNGFNLVAVRKDDDTAGTTGTESTQIRRVRSGTPVDMLSTPITIDSTEQSSATAATPPVINASNDDIQTGDWIYTDQDTVQTTKAKGGVVHMTFAKP